jgi:uncharacterized protein (DUF927 family)
LEASGLVEKKFLNDKRNSSVESKKNEKEIKEEKVDPKIEQYSQSKNSKKQEKNSNEKEKKQNPPQNGKVNFKNLTKTELLNHKKESDSKFETLIQKRVQLALQMKQLEEEITAVVNERNDLTNFLLNSK